MITCQTRPTEIFRPSHFQEGFYNNLNVFGHITRCGHWAFGHRPLECHQKKKKHFQYLRGFVALSELHIIRHWHMSRDSQFTCYVEAVGQSQKSGQVTHTLMFDRHIFIILPCSCKGSSEQSFEHRGGLALDFFWRSEPLHHAVEWQWQVKFTWCAFRTWDWC